MNFMKTEDQVKGLFALVEIKIVQIWQITNQYWGLREEKDARWTFLYPWWLVMTPHGLIEIGPRKHVYSINWKHTPVRAKLVKGRLDHARRHDDALLH